MGGVDIADQLRSYYKTQRTERRNWLPLFYWLLNLSIINSFIMYQTVQKDTESYTCNFTLPRTGQQLAFRRHLVEILISKSPTKAYSTRPIYASKNNTLPPPIETSSKHDFTYTNTRRECYYSKSRYKCTICNVHFCLFPCFKMYHKSSSVSSRSHSISST
ncbi:hypothetical protein L211DRAFT_831819 [Terfezia boudieri ATCC MYA-4762]|uniref:PiggyBac transposable element-derived protein domain-containing protein n=1 Tax=Terfezia boudieri ATCC MYA-4762 TaxID=1051890 RepID=A0A3N4L946_9PEZI|nr:hypothetical protein L211DRAFT_831819 [Terfezia boudieri ATCC MYA-4762]